MGDKPNPDDIKPVSETAGEKDEIEKINDEFRESQKPVPPGKPTGVFKGLDVDLKLAKIMDAIPEIVNQSLQPFKDDLAEQRTRLDETIDGVNNLIAQLNATPQPQQGQTPQPGNAALNEFNQMPPEVKQQVGMEFVKTIIDSYAKIKGAGAQAAQAQQGQGFDRMMVEWGAQMFRYHLDSMAQSVYNIRLPPPASAAAGERIPLVQPPQPQQPQEHKIE